MVLAALGVQLCLRNVLESFSDMFLQPTVLESMGKESVDTEGGLCLTSVTVAPLPRSQNVIIFTYTPTPPSSQCLGFPIYSLFL